MRAQVRARGAAIFMCSALWLQPMALATGQPGEALATSPSVTPEAFGAIGDGVTDDTEAWRLAVASGRDITANRTYRITDTVMVERPNARIDGLGRLVAAPSLAGKSLLEMRGSDCLIQGLTFENPSEAQTRTGPISAAIRISADRCRIVGNRVDRFQNGIVVSAEGEFFDNVIEGNVVSNVIGVGGGPSDSTTADGEDRGDGIASWGARTRIVGNVVTAKPGTDARVGVHVEALPFFKARPATAEDERGAEIRRNRVAGPFRRGIVNEGLYDVVIADNDLPGGYTWWAIAVVQGAGDTLVEGNRIVFDRRPDNQSGAAWSYWPAAVQLAAFGQSSLGHVTVENNEISVTRNGGEAIQYQNALGSERNFSPATIRGNRIWFTGGPQRAPVALPGGTRLNRRSGDNRVMPVDRAPPR